MGKCSYFVLVHWHYWLISSLGLLLRFFTFFKAFLQTGSETGLLSTYKILPLQV